MTSKHPIAIAFAIILLVLLVLNISTACASAQIRDRRIFRERLPRNNEQPVGSGEMMGQLTFQRRERTYYLYTPRRYNRNNSMPLVIAFHGGYGSGSRFARTTGFNALADRKGFIVVYPDAFDKHWNDGRGTANPDVDDIGFVRALINRLSQIRNIDRSRIYATGISNGGFFTQYLACEMSDKIAAFAAVASTLPQRLQSRCKPKKPVAMLMINSPEDQFVPWKGGESAGEGGQILSVPKTVEWWRQHNSCSLKAQTEVLPQTASNDGTKVTVSRYSGCRGGSEITLYTIEGGGHTWPDGFGQPPRLFGTTSRQINASEVIWQFFQSHALS